MPCKYEAFYNIVHLNESSIITAIGSCSEIGWKPVLKKIDKLNYRFTLERESDQGAEIPKEFAICAVVEASYRSINIQDDNGSAHVLDKKLVKVTKPADATDPGIWAVAFKVRSEK